MATGTVTPTTQTQVPVNDTTTLVLAANLNRQYVALKNVSDTQISLKIDAAAVVEDGTVLEAGESYEMSEAIGNLVTGAINGITASGTKVIAVYEAEGT